MDNKTVLKGEALASYVEPHEYGDIIHYQEIERVTEERRGSPRYYNAIAKAKKLLEGRSKMIIHIGGGDYRVAYPGDYAKEYVGQVKKAHKRLKHGQRILNGAPIKDMNDDERNTFNHVYDFNARLSASFAGSVTEVKRLAGKQHPLESALTQGRR